MSITVDMSELDAVVDLLKTEPYRAADVLHGATIAVGAKVQAAAKAAAPRDRPWLATEGIRRKTWRDMKGTHTDIFTVPDPEGRPVGVFVEYGTSDTPPQPFLVPQATMAETALPALIEQKIDPLRGA